MSGTTQAGLRIASDVEQRSGVLFFWRA